MGGVSGASGVATLVRTSSVRDGLDLARVYCFSESGSESVTAAVSVAVSVAATALEAVAVTEAVAESLSCPSSSRTRAFRERELPWLWTLLGQRQHEPLFP